MITNCGNYCVECVPDDFIGLSTDDKPMNVANSSIFYEMDTKKMFMFDAQNKVWLEQ